MKVFVTGATGFVGSTVVQELISAGHQVLALVRSAEGAQRLMAAGAEIHHGDLTDLESLKAGVSEADGIIHTGFIHDFTRFKEVCEVDRKAILAMGEVIRGSNRPFIVTSALAPVAHGGVISEDDRATSSPHPRAASEHAVDELVSQGIRVAVVRLPPSVHGTGDTHGFVPTLIRLARKNGKAAYIEDGANAWSAIHRLDAVKVYVAALEKDFEPGTRYHAVGEQEIPLWAIATVIGEQLSLPVVSLSEQEAHVYFDSFFHFAKLHAPTSGKKTQRDLGCKPVHPTLLEDLKNNIYF